MLLNGFATKLELGSREAKAEGFRSSVDELDKQEIQWKDPF